jgi:hypothetical protein
MGFMMHLNGYPDEQKAPLSQQFLQVSEVTQQFLQVPQQFLQVSDVLHLEVNPCYPFQVASDLCD